MIEWLALHGSVAVMLAFLAIFLGFGLWAYYPANKVRLEDYGRIPLREGNDGE